MTKIDNQQTAGLDKKRGLFAALPDASNEDSSGGAQSDLFEEFSSILDKIAQHVNSSSFRKNDPKSATIDLALSTEVARMPKPEAERPVTRVEKARPIYSESSKENEQPAKTKVDRKASEETSDRPESERKSEKNADTERQSSES